MQSQASGKLLLPLEIAAIQHLVSVLVDNRNKLDIREKIEEIQSKLVTS